MFNFAKWWIVKGFKIYKVGGVRNKQNKKHFKLELSVVHTREILSSENLFLDETLKVKKIGVTIWIYKSLLKIHNSKATLTSLKK